MLQVILHSVFAASFTLALFSAAPLHAASKSLSQDTMDICAAHRNFEDGALEQSLLRAGWTRLDGVPNQQLKDVLRDGMVISIGVNLSQKIDWAKAQAGADGAIEKIIGMAADPRILRLYKVQSDQHATLIVLPRSQEDVDLLHCYYSGPISEGQAKMMNLVKEMDEKAGLRHANPEFQLMNRRASRPMAGGPGMKQVDLNMSIYLLPMNDIFGRAAATPMGFSQVAVFPK